MPCGLYKRIDGLVIMLYAFRDERLLAERNCNPERGWARACVCVSKKTEQLLACGRTMGGKLHRQSVVFAHWVATRAGAVGVGVTWGSTAFSGVSFFFFFIFIFIGYSILSGFYCFCRFTCLPNYPQKEEEVRESKTEQIDLLTFGTELHL